MNKPSLNQSAASKSEGRQAVCFVVDTDFVYLREFAKSLRGLGFDTVELINSRRLGENVESLSPDLIFLNLSEADPSDCVRALLALKESKFAGRVQLMGRCEPAFLESFRKVGSEASLKLLTPLQKPIDLSTVRRIAHEQQLNCQSVAPPDLSLKKALASNWVQFLYQPQVELENKLIVGAETFVRVFHPQHGLLSPERFLGGAADDDLVELATRALVSALKTSAKLFEAGVLVKVAVNISVETLMKLPVAEIVGKHRPADRRWPGITFDIAETQALSKMPLLKSKLPELGKCGVSVALDNFGRGNSSFEIFRHLQFAEVKIDRSFVHGCNEDKFQAGVCKSVVQLAHNFACKASAVGVETNVEAIALQDFGCDFGQGFLFDRPMPEQDLMIMVRQLAPPPQGGATRKSA